MSDCAFRESSWDSIRLSEDVYKRQVKPALSECAKTIDELEELTGLDFFHNLPDNLENAVESKYAISAWTGLQ